MRNTYLVDEPSSPDKAKIDVPRHVPLALKAIYSSFALVMIFTYFRTYGPTNFIYFCDQAVLLTLAGVWLESPLLISLCAVGILGPQILWVVDFLATAVGHPLTGMTAYMFDAKKPLFLRFLSSFHGWLPFLLVYLVHRLGYDRRALPIWTAMATATLLVCFFLMPGPRSDAGLLPVNINYVRGFSDSVVQAWMPAWAWLTCLICGLPILIFVPTHLLLRRFMPTPAQSPAPSLRAGRGDSEPGSSRLPGSFSCRW